MGLDSRQLYNRDLNYGARRTRNYGTVKIMVQALSLRRYGSAYVRDRFTVIHFSTLCYRRISVLPSCPHVP
ncbi:hypothetical protein RvY_13324 [Ramazzottius varieornatus]|uniref:Uncharacterized protein n=1 Tax=Ramazzottius varieornatus TaxID=947166 RepID=A0A1D1VUZ6_RAMVA|nr:hypothetical protein RvY_13324 [Ramazzottius varieornatus]